MLEERSNMGFYFPRPTEESMASAFVRSVLLMSNGHWTKMALCFFQNGETMRRQLSAPWVGIWGDLEAFDKSCGNSRLHVRDHI